MRRSIAALFSTALLGVGGVLAATPPAHALDSRVATISFTFIPPAVPLTAGSGLTYTNLDAVGHNLISDGRHADGTPLFSSPAVVGTGVSVPVSGVELLGAGTYPFTCTIHPFMHGQLVVVAAPGTPAGPPTPVTVPAIPAVPVAPAPAPGAPGAGATSSEWAQYGHDSENTRISTGGPAANSIPLLKPAWRLDVADGDFTGTPAVVDGNVFVGSNGGVVRALDAAGGSVKWTYKLPAGDGVDSSLAVDNGLVFAAVARVGAPYVLALHETDGTFAWRATIDSQPGSDVYGSPVVAGGRVYIGVSGQNGDPDSNLRGGVQVIDEPTGALGWHAFTVPPGFNGGAVFSTPAIDLADGVLFAGTGNAYHLVNGAAADTTDSIVEMRLSDGAIVSHLQGTANDAFSGGSPAGLDFDFGASPNLIRDAAGHLVAVGEGQKSGAYWRVPLSPGPPGTPPVLDSTHAQATHVGPGAATGGILGSTAYDASSQRVFGPISVPGYVWSLDAGTGLPSWVSPGLADPIHFGPVAASNGVLYSVNSSGFLDAWLAATGVPLAHLPLNTVPPTDPSSYALGFGGVSVAEGRVFANTGSQGVHGSVVAFAP
ncbi:MAG: outer membrane protein assembly factor BamB family protein [Acidimicrobiales bacterium]